MSMHGIGGDRVVATAAASLSGTGTDGAGVAGDPTRQPRSAGGPGGWKFWEVAALRGAGFPAALASSLEGRDAAALADQLATDERAVSETRRLALRRLTVLATCAPPDDRRMLNARRRRITAGSVAASAHVTLEEQVLAAALRKREASRARFHATYLEDFAGSERRLAGVAATQDFQEAALWQNGRALEQATDNIMHVDPRRRRSAAHLLALLVQRYTLKNDSIGFYGPVGWVTLDASASTSTLRPGGSLVASRQISFEGWAIDAVAEALGADPRIRPFLRPRLHPGLWVDQAGIAYLPNKTPVALPPLQRQALALCDGERTASEVLEQLLQSGAASAAAEDVLKALEDRGMLFRRLEVPPQLRPETHLHRTIADLPADVGAPLLRRLDSLLAARDRIAQASGAPSRLRGALLELDRAFTTITNRPAYRSNGQAYAARRLVYEDCRRDCAVSLGRDTLARLFPPLQLFLHAARWAASEVHAVFGAYLLERLTAFERLDTGVRDAQAFYEFARPSRETLEAILAPTAEQFRQKWRRILAPLQWPHSVHPTEDITAAVLEAFTTASPVWSKAQYFCPDILFGAPDGPSPFVLGEVHSTHTLMWSAICNQHETPEAIRQQLTEDTERRPVFLKQVEKRRWVARMNFGAVPPHWYRYEFHEDLPSRPGCTPLPAGRFVPHRGPDTVLLQARDRSFTFDARELYGGDLSRAADHLTSGFLDEGSHSPRVSVGALTIARERWQVSPLDMSFLRLKSHGDQFYAVRQWAAARGIPRRTFFKSPAEPKPCYLDLASPVMVDVFVSFMRKLSGDDVINITEMLPAFGDTWLVDRAQQGYTSEVRLVATAAHPGRESVE